MGIDRFGAHAERSGYLLRAQAPRHFAKDVTLAASQAVTAAYRTLLTQARQLAEQAATDCCCHEVFASRHLA